MANKARSFEFARFGPVHFQPLEWELEAVQSYIGGHILNAGCGHRNIDHLLLRMGASAVVNYDLESNIDGAVRGSLTDISFPDNSFDTVFCNAVLEHVPRIDLVVRELYRVVKPKGVVIIGVPFLQPYHADPTDYRRYTSEGLNELCELVGLQVVEVLPVHCIAQTLGWISWEWAQEKGGWRPILIYPLVWFATRLFHRTDRKLERNANSFQIIGLKE